MELYSWGAALSLWKKVGDVVGSSGGSQVSSGKTVFEGQVRDRQFPKLKDAKGKVELYSWGAALSLEES